MVFVPMRRAQAARLRESPFSGDLAGFAATDDLRAALADPEATEEEVDFAATAQAGLAALLDPAPDGTLRLIVALAVPAQQVCETTLGLGAVSVRGAVWSCVQALFCDEEAAADAVAAARRAARGHRVDDVLEIPEVHVLLDAYDLLWYAPEELDRLPT